MEAIIQKRFDSYLDPKNQTSYAVLIDGPWGSGKTYFIREYATKQKLKELNQKGTPKFENWPSAFIPIRFFARKIWKTKITYKRFVYVSLGGISNLDELGKAIYQEMYPIVKNKSVQFASKLFQSFVKLNYEISFKAAAKNESSGLIGLDSTGVNDLGRVFGESTKCIYIFDDLDRSTLPLDSFLGFISDLTTIEHKKVLLITNIGEMVDKGEILLRHSEKLIGFMVSIKANFDSTFNSLIKGHFLEHFLLKHRDTLQGVFEKSKTSNLRYLEHFIEVFSKLSNSFGIENKIFENDEYCDILLKMLFPLLILKRLPISEDEFNVDFDGYLNDSTVLGRYLVKDYELRLQGNEIELLNIARDFINSEQLDLEKLYDNYRFHRTNWKKNMPNWLRLWYFREIEDNELFDLLNEVEKEIESKEIQNFGVLIHLFGIYQMLSQKPGYESYTDGFLKKFTDYCSSILRQDSIDLKKYHWILKFNDHQVLGYSIWEYEHDNVKGFIEKLKKEVQYFVNLENKRLAKDHVELFNTNSKAFVNLIKNEKDFNSIPQSSDPSVQLQTVFFVTEHPVYEQANPTLVIKQLLLLSNAEKGEVLYYFLDRYTNRPNLFQLEKKFCMELAKEIHHYISESESFLPSHYLLEEFAFLLENGKGRE